MQYRNHNEFEHVCGRAATANAQNGERVSVRHQNDKFMGKTDTQTNENNAVDMLTTRCSHCDRFTKPVYEFVFRSFTAAEKYAYTHMEAK